MSGLLAEILASTRERVARIDTGRRRALERRAARAPTPRDFLAALTTGATLGLIAEIKRRSPSKGELAPDLDPATTAKAYEAGGACALSVLTDGPYFGGSIGDLEAARAATGLPVLRKDFMVDPVQLVEARAAGADAVLLIVAALDDPMLTDLHAHATDLGLGVLVEAHSEEELERALACDARIIGINARDLSDFSEDLGRIESMVSRLPTGIVRVAESAIRNQADAERMAAAGFDALLVGEALMRAPDVEASVRALATVPRQR